MTTMPVAAWYQDHREPHLMRYWDGARWTEHTAPMPSAVPAPVPAQVATRPAPRRTAPERGATTTDQAPTIEELISGCRLEEPRQPLDEQVELTGETYYVKSIKKVFRQHGMPITERGSTLDVRCVLVPNPWNPHDPNA